MATTACSRPPPPHNHPRRSRMKKRRLSFQAIFAREVQVETRTNASPGNRNYKTLPRSFAGYAHEYAATASAYYDQGDAVSATYYDAPSADTLSVPTAMSPNESFLLDDDPFADLTGGPLFLVDAPGDQIGSPGSSMSSPTSPSSSPEPVAVPLPPVPQPPPVSRTVSSQAIPAYQKPAFKPRPSLPSLHTLAQMNLVVPHKVRRGRVGAGLPYEPWDLDTDSLTQSPASASSDVSVSANTGLPVGTSPPALSPPPESALTPETSIPPPTPIPTVIATMPIPTSPMPIPTSITTTSVEPAAAASTTPTPMSVLSTTPTPAAKSDTLDTFLDLSNDDEPLLLQLPASATHSSPPSRSPSYKTSSSSPSYKSAPSPASPPNKAAASLALDPLKVSVEFALSHASQPAPPTAPQILSPLALHKPLPTLRSPSPPLKVPTPPPKSPRTRTLSLSSVHSPSAHARGDSQVQAHDSAYTSIPHVHADSSTILMSVPHARPSLDFAVESVRTDFAVVSESPDRDPGVVIDDATNVTGTNGTKSETETNATVSLQNLNDDGIDDNMAEDRSENEDDFAQVLDSAFAQIQERISPAATAAEDQFARSQNESGMLEESELYMNYDDDEGNDPDVSNDNQNDVPDDLTQDPAFAQNATDDDVSGGYAAFAALAFPSTAEDAGISPAALQRSLSRRRSVVGETDVSGSGSIGGEDVERSSHTHAHSGSSSSSCSSSSSKDKDTVRRRRFRKSSLFGDVLRFAPASPNAPSAPWGPAGEEGVRVEGLGLGLERVSVLGLERVGDPDTVFEQVDEAFERAVDGTYDEMVMDDLSLADQLSLDDVAFNRTSAFSTVNDSGHEALSPDYASQAFVPDYTGVAYDHSGGITFPAAYDPRAATTTLDGSPANDSLRPHPHPPPPLCPRSTRIMNRRMRLRAQPRHRQHQCPP
ncbi:hypothetical protein C8R43DRAFT_694820 [Mycena crocata]|nr:hypothetical protein C8R43DRAFT_694820 [Mycena crocata]